MSFVKRQLDVKLYGERPDDSKYKPKVKRPPSPIKACGLCGKYKDLKGRGLCPACYEAFSASLKETRAHIEKIAPKKDQVDSFDPGAFFSYCAFLLFMCIFFTPMMAVLWVVGSFVVLKLIEVWNDVNAKPAIKCASRHNSSK